MSNTVNSPYMSLPVPVVGEEAGPQYAIDINACLAIIDQHNHTPGSGQAITPAAMNINADLTFNNNNATNFKAVRFFPQLTPIPATGVQLGQLYEAGVDLWFNDGAGNQIRMTQSGAVAGTPGSISGLVPPASASYNAINGTFVFQSAAATPANIDVASVILRNFVANSKGLTLNPPAAMGSDFSITLPTLPASNLPLSIDNTGLMSAAQITFVQLAPAVQQKINTAPTVQTFITVGPFSYVTPTNPAPLYVEIEAVAGGGGGGSPFGGGGAAGGTTTFSSFLTVFGGSGGSAPNTNAVGAGGGFSVTGPAIDLGSESGGQGGASGAGSGGQNLSGAMGGANPLGGAGGGGGGNSGTGGNGGNGSANTGAGGGGGGEGGGQFGGGGGGGASGYGKIQINSPSGTYGGMVGGGGGGASAGGPAGAGGNGADGRVIVREFYGA